jgi:hypothetical protein
VSNRRSRYRPPALNRDHARPRTAPAQANPAVEARLTELVSPAAFALGDEYGRLGLRARALALPVMVAVVLAMIWRQVPSVSELSRVLAREGLLWAPARAVSQQALSLRLRCLPADLFRRVLADLQATLAARAAARSRPLPPVVARALDHFACVWAVDGTTLEALFKKVGLLREGGEPSRAASWRRCSTWPPSCRSTSGSTPTRPPTTSASWSGCRPSCRPTPCS